MLLLYNDISEEEYLDLNLDIHKIVLDTDIACALLYSSDISVLFDDIINNNYNGVLLNLNKKVNSSQGDCYVMDFLNKNYLSMVNSISSFNRRNSEESFPFIIGFNFESSPLGYPFKNVDLRNMMQKGIFACFEQPLTLEKYLNLGNWAELDSGESRGRIIALAGTKTVGKTEVWNHMHRFHRRYKGIWKYSTRSVRTDDIGDTRSMSLFSSDKKNHIYWGSYGNECVISKDIIDYYLSKGSDPIVTIGSPDGIESLFDLYGEKVDCFLLTRNEKEIIESLEERNKYVQIEKPIDFDKILRMQHRFIDFFKANHSPILESRSFFNIAREIETYLANKDR